jgi:hypothetical protein
MKRRVASSRRPTEWLFIEELADPVSDIILDSAGALLAAFLSLACFVRGPTTRTDPAPKK